MFFGHGVQEVAPGGENVPLAHGRHTASDVAPLITEKVPEGHLLHAAAESAPSAWPYAVHGPSAAGQPLVQEA